MTNVRGIALPYGIEIEDGLAVRVFNRSYQTLARFTLRRRLTPAQRAAMSVADHDGCLWFYDDVCVPYGRNTDDTEAYLRRIERFVNVDADDRNRPRRAVPLRDAADPLDDRP